MSSRRGPGISDAELMISPHVIGLLAAVAQGAVVRGSGSDSSIFAPHVLDGENVRLRLVMLARDELIEMPISGPPRVAPRGERILAIVEAELGRPDG